MKSKSKDLEYDIFAGVYVYKNEFVFVKRVNGKHIAMTKSGIRFRPFDVVTKGRRVDMSKKSEDTLN